MEVLDPTHNLNWYIPSVKGLRLGSGPVIIKLKGAMTMCRYCFEVQGNPLYLHEDAEA